MNVLKAVEKGWEETLAVAKREDFKLDVFESDRHKTQTKKSEIISRQVQLMDLKSVC